MCVWAFSFFLSFIIKQIKLENNNIKDVNGNDHYYVTASSNFRFGQLHVFDAMNGPVWMPIEMLILDRNIYAE